MTFHLRGMKNYRHFQKSFRRLHRRPNCRRRYQENRCLHHPKRKQAMMTLQGMADHRFTSVSLFTNVFLGEIIFSP